MDVRQPLRGLQEVFPDGTLGKQLAPLAHPLQQLHQVPPLCQLCHDTEHAAILEGIEVAHHVRVVQRPQSTDLVRGIPLLLSRHVLHEDLLDRNLLTIGSAARLVDDTLRSATQLRPEFIVGYSSPHRVARWEILLRLDHREKRKESRVHKKPLLFFLSLPLFSLFLDEGSWDPSDEGSWDQSPAQATAEADTWPFQQQQTQCDRFRSNNSLTT